MNKKYQIFISSTFSDLVEERQDAMKIVLDLGHIPSGMEIFPAADVEQFEYIKKVIDECDYYVLIIGARYGSVDAAGVSFTEKEYDYAVSNKKTVLAFIHGDPGTIPVAKVDTVATLASSLTAFRAKVSKGRLVKFWRSRDELKHQVVMALAKAFSDTPAVGWIRGDAAASEDLLSQINALRIQLDKLKDENATLQAQSQPQLDGIARLSDTFDVRYYWEAFRSTGPNQKGSNTLTLTWAEIFVAIGPALVRPTSPGIISVKLIHYMQENYGISFYKITIFQGDEDRIKIHLAALGLIDVYAASEASGGGVAEFLSLTPFGRRQLLELMAVKGRTDSIGS
jgi:Domain of unknown function (DUF4062)